MAVNFSAAVRTNMAAGINTAVGANAVLHIHTGAVPANTSASNSSANICAITLSGAPFTAANGALAKANAWSANASANGTAGNFRIFASDASTCHIQGNCAIGSGDMSFDNTSITVNQTITITAFTLTIGNS